MATKKREVVEAEELKAGERALAELVPALASVEGARTPRQELLSTVREVLSWQERLLGQLGAITPGVFDAGYVAGLVTGVKRVPTVCRALIYVETKVLAARLTERTASEAEARLETLRGVGLELLRLLVASGHVPGQTLKQITQGHGRVDHARDAVQLGEVLSERWEVADALQALQAPGVARLSAAERDELHALGIQALEALEGAPEAGSLEAWEGRYGALAALLKADWDRAVRAVRYAASEGALQGEAAPTFTTLRR